MEDDPTKSEQLVDRTKLREKLDAFSIAYDSEMLGAWATDEQLVDYLLGLPLDDYGIGLEDLVDEV